jgi:hypothetical protein
MISPRENVSDIGIYLALCLDPPTKAGPVEMGAAPVSNQLSHLDRGQI